MSDIDSLQLLSSVRAHSPNTATIILTGHGSTVSALAALRKDADDYFLKPSSTREILSSVRNALLKRQKAENRQGVLAPYQIGQTIMP